MTMRRLDRKRLFEAEKLGKTVDAGASIAMKESIVSTTQHREGHKLITDVVVDLGSSKVSVISGGDASADEDVIGPSSGASYVCRLTNSVFGAVTSIETVCLEALVGSDGALAGTNAIQLVRGTNGDGALNGTDGAQNDIVADIGDATGKHTLTQFQAASTLEDEYIYFALDSAAASTTATATATITVTDDDANNIQNGVTRISIVESDGTVYNIFADTATAFNAAQSANEFNVGSVTGRNDIAEGIKIALNGTNSPFTAARTDNVVTVTSDAAGVIGNQSNFFADGDGLTASISVTDFSGGKTKGDDNPITAGKFLLRFTGFVEPSDI